MSGQAKIQENLAQISIESIQQSLDELDTYIEDTATANAEDKEYFTNCRMQVRAARSANPDSA